METPYADEFLKKALGPQAQKITVPGSLFEGKHIEPVFDDAITVLLSSSSNYACYLGVAVESLLKNRDKNKNYDLIVFETTLNDGHKNSITKRVSKESGCSIRFINVSESLSSYNNLFYVYNNFSKETYYRLFAAELLYSYDKVIYIDADTLVLSDLTELWSTDIDNFYIAGVKDYVLQGYAKNHEVKKGGDIRKYIEEVLDLRYQDYIQCGILLMNLKEMRRSGFVEKALNILQLLRTPLFVDQDVLNKACEGKIATLPPRYNFLMYYASRIDEIDYSFRAEIAADKDNIKIFHMPGGHPDEFPHLEMSTLYFSYARESCLYEEIINKMIHVYYLRSIGPHFNKIDHRINTEMQNIHNAFNEVRQENENLRHQIELLKEFSFCHYSIFNYYRYKIMSKITFGNLRKHYKRKYRALKKFRSHALKPILDQYHI